MYSNLFLLLCVFVCGISSVLGVAQTQGWLYDAGKGDPACDASNTYKNNQIDVLKPGFISVDDDGKLSFDNTTSLCNGGSNEFIEEIKQYSTFQYATIGTNDNGVKGVQALVSNPTRSATAISQLVAFTTETGFSGIEIDLEGFENWSSDLYNQYIDFLTNLGNQLHAAGKLLMIDAPAISSQDSQAYYANFTYEGLNGVPVDYITIMAYDGYYDGTCGTAVASNEWVNNITQWAFDKIDDHSRIVMGIPAYGYHCKTGTTDFPDSTDTLVQSQNFPGFSSAQRDPDSFELSWEHGGISYLCTDQTGLDMKRKMIESWGVEAVSVWFLGDNAWFSQ